MGQNPENRKIIRSIKLYKNGKWVTVYSMNWFTKKHFSVCDIFEFFACVCVVKVIIEWIMS